ncbi:class I SAM-dependent methyltransferase, partial [Robbsia andropogonis]|uniref:class I SAM-dependent methyltransferase n=1 Tax=Robbsia andropogonis TaxID=28092 RepID=UPI001C925AA0
QIDRILVRGQDQGWEFCSGTLYFGKTALAGRLLDQWVKRCDADPTLWDQIHLCSAWCDISSVAPLKTVWLPRSYLQIADAPIFCEPVIRHWQASRASKADGRALNAHHYPHTHQGIQCRLHNLLWRKRAEAFWIAQDTVHIKPDTGLSFPEDFDLGAALRESIGQIYPVLEVGCGVGRIASLFGAGEYIGVDINPLAVAVARQMLPDHQIRLTDHGIQYPEALTALLFNVLLHVSDVAVVPLLKEIAEGRIRIVVAELMDRWRRDGAPTVFNRNSEEYVLTMSKLGFRLAFYSKYPYAGYDKEGLAQNSRITFLTFDRIEVR